MSEPQLPQAVQRLVDAINAADTEAFVAAFTDDGYVDDWGRVLSGPAGVRSWAETDAIGAGARMTVLEASTSDDVTELRFGWSSRVFNGESSAFATVRDDRVAAFRIPPHA
ncbi:nuclear transport factor 2 family protein [Leucobacter allii]|uniref:nuclear transport factor 2 family protein n=1 Tax=Leucobacter allii TaxID=2932247 RepID=UPI001FD10A22|nr:nuclear transport factor 2 family protein [Leucobacter allii]UOR01774.1 nuclear transport factor 2 family protein [Leucobacter allii]